MCGLEAEPHDGCSSSNAAQQSQVRSAQKRVHLHWSDHRQCSSCCCVAAPLATCCRQLCLLGTSNTVAGVLQAHMLPSCTSHTYEFDGHKLTGGLVPTEPSHSKVATAYVSYLRKQQHSRCSTQQQHKGMMMWLCSKLR